MSYRTIHPSRTSRLAQAVALALLFGAAAEATAATTYADPGKIGDPASWRTDEFKADWGLGAIGADYAYARGLTGQGIALGQYDTGIFVQHPEFAGTNKVIALTIGDPSCAPKAGTVVFGGCYYSRGDQPTLAVQSVFWDAKLDPDLAADPYAYGEYGEHGTHVAGTMVADRNGEGMHGVAFGSQLVTGRFFVDSLQKSVQNPDGSWTYTSQGSSPWPERAEVLNFFDQVGQHSVRAVNVEIELAVSPTDTVDDVRKTYEGNKDYYDAFVDGAIKNNVIFVDALGNYSNVDTSGKHNYAVADIYPGMPAFRPDAQPYWLSVAALQQDGNDGYTIADYSSTCSYTKRWCVSAPGSDIYSTENVHGLVFHDLSDGPIKGTGTDDDPYSYEQGDQKDQFTAGYGLMSGTSMAAPHAIGALSLLFERYPYLTGTQVRDVLLTTATDLGAPGDDDIYGWGLINLQKAVNGPGQFIDDTDLVMNQRAGGAKVWQGDAWDDWSNDISGTGKLTKSGIGWLRLSGNNSFGGATVKDGVLELNGRNALQDDVHVQGGALMVNGELDNRLSIESGMASVAGTVTGATQVQDGTLDLSGKLVNTLSIDKGMASVAGKITGATQVQGGGTLDLTGVLDNTLAVDSGTASVDGKVTGATSIGVAGMLIGNGSLGTTTVAGTIAPGHSIGTLTINGNYTQMAGSTYLVELQPPSSADMLSVTGAATLEGGTVKAIGLPGAYVLGQQYHILSARTGIYGQFADIDASAVSPFLALSLAYSPDDIDLAVSRGRTFASAGITLNQRRTGAGIDSLADSSPVVQSLVQLFPEQAAPVFDGLSGEVHASTRAVLLDDSHTARDSALQRARGGNNTLATGASSDDPFGAWVDVQRGSGHLQGDSNTALTDHDGNTELVGADYQFDAGWRLGALGGLGKSDLHIGARDSRADIDTRFAGLYGGQNWGAFGLRGGVSYAWHDVDTDRQVNYPGFSDKLHASYNARTRQAFIESGYAFGNDQWTVEPYLQYARVKVDTDGFQESGAAAALRGEAGDASVGLSTAGTRFKVTMPGFGSSRIDLSGGLGYRMANGDRSPRASLAFAGGSSFDVLGAPIAHASALVDLGVGIHLGKTGLLQAGYHGQLSDDAKNHGANVQFSMQF